MDDLNRDIKDAFEAEWGSRAEAPGLSRAIAQVPGRGRSRVHLLPSLAAVSAAALFVAAGAFALTRSPHRTPPSPVPAGASPTPPVVIVPAPSPSSDPEPDYGTPPAGVPLFYYIDKRQPSWLVGVDWAGKIRGTVKLPASVQNPTYVIASPDGSRFQADGAIYDTSGNNLGVISQTKESFMFADDNRHVCGMTPTSSQTAASVPTRLFTQLPGQPRHYVATVGTAHNQSGSAVYACSFKAGVAVVSDGYMSAANTWVVSLVDGRVISHHAYPTSTTDTIEVIASPDGAYIAEMVTILGTPPDGKPKAGPTTIRDSRTGRVVATPAGNPKVLSFSADGSSVLLESFGPDTVSLRSTLTQALRWGPIAVPSPKYLDYFNPTPYQPNGLGFVLPWTETLPDCSGSNATCSPFGHIQDLLVVHGDGTRTASATGVLSVPNH